MTYLVHPNHKRNPKNCTCNPQYNQLYFYWDHSYDCACIHNPDTEDTAEERRIILETNQKLTVEHHIENKTLYRCSPELVKKYYPEEWEKFINEQN